MADDKIVGLTLDLKQKSSLTVNLTRDIGIFISTLGCFIYIFKASCIKKLFLLNLN